MIIRQPVKLTIMLAMLAGAILVAWWYFNPTKAPAALRDYLPIRQDAGAILYHWRDDDGTLQITDHPPGDRDYEEVFYPGDANVVPGTQAADN